MSTLWYVKLLDKKIVVKVVQVKTFPSISNWIVWGSIDYIKHHFLYKKRKQQFVKEHTFFLVLRSCFKIL